MSDSGKNDQEPVTKKPSLGRKDTTVGSRKNDLVGVLVLAAGIAFLLAVVAYIYMDQAGESSEPTAAHVAEAGDQPKTDGSDDEASDVSGDGDCVGCEVAAPEMAGLPDAGQMVTPEVTDLSGRWVASFKGSVAELVLAGQQFQIIYMKDPKSGFRKYARGYFSL